MNKLYFGIAIEIPFRIETSWSFTLALIANFIPDIDMRGSLHDPALVIEVILIIS